VSLPSRPSAIVGRASIEDPDFQTNQACTAADGVVVALVVNRARRRTGYGFAFGSLSSHHTAFDVLFVRRAHIEGFEPAYERIGAGNLFGNEVEMLFEWTEEAKL